MITPDDLDLLAVARGEAMTMCLLHGDYHVMQSDCWGATLEWWMDRQPTTEADLLAERDRYQAAVERKMLDQLIKKLAPIPLGTSALAVLPVV